MSDEKKPVEQASPDDGATGPGPGSGAGTAAGARTSQQPPPIPEGLEALIGPEQLREMISALQAELDKKAAEAAAKHDQFVRAVAETENVRRRLEKEKEETARYAISKFAKDVLSVGDNFQRTISAVSAEAANADPVLKNFLDGVVLAERDFQAALERNGVKLVDPAGQPFNPHHHQAVMEKEDASVPNGTVLQVFQAGYLIDDRCLRPAMVVVSRGGPKASKAADAGGGPSNGNGPEPDSPPEGA